VKITSIEQNKKSRKYSIIEIDLKTLIVDNLTKKKSMPFENVRTKIH